MDEQAELHDGTVSSRYVVGLHKSDLAALGEVAKPLLSELRQAITNHAQFESYSLEGEVEVALIEDVAMRLGSCVVSPAQLATADTGTRVAAHTSSDLVPESTPVPESTYVLVLADGSRHALVGDLVTIGRQATCTIVIADNNISRVHARFRSAKNNWTIEDLGSTNGTRVGGELITEPTPLVDGQQIALGSLQMRFEQA